MTNPMTNHRTNEHVVRIKNLDLIDILLINIFRIFFAYFNIPGVKDLE